MTVDQPTEPQQEQLVDVVPEQEDDNDDDATSTEPRRKTRRSRRGGYRRKRQQQKKIAALMAESAARREEGAKPAKDDSSTATATTDGETSSCESAGSPERTVARKKRNNPRKEQQQQQYQGYYNNMMYNNHAMMMPAVQAPYQQQQYYGAMPQQSASPNKRGGKKRELTKQQKDLYVALDCEMVGVGEYGAHSVLARVTMIDWYGNTLMDELVKPQWEVTDYRTFVSGITKEMLDAAKVDFATCQKQVLALLHGKILVGHGLKSDLSVLGITHPWYMIRDTAKYEPYMKIRYQDGGLWPRALKDLCKEMLNRDIQVQGRAHCPKEDAMAALDLYKCVLEPWENSMEYHWNRSITMQRHRMARQQRAVVAM